MGYPNLRYSPSGPEILNGHGSADQPGGAPLTPGEGMQLRLSETIATATLTLTAGLVEIGAENLRATLSNPNPQKNYRAEFAANFESAAGDGQCIITIQRSLDNGATWAVMQQQTFETGTAGEERYIRCVVPMALGSGGTFDIDAMGYPSLMVAAFGSLGGGTNGAIVAPAGHILLAELF